MKQMLSPKELAEAIGVSESSLKRWADTGRLRADRTVGGHRRIPLQEALRFVRREQLHLARPEVLGLPELAHAEQARRATDDLGDALYDKLLAGDATAVRGIVLDLYLRGQSVAAICDGPIRTAMQRVGDLWKHDSRGIFIEHRATDLCILALNLLRSLMEPVPHVKDDGDAAPVAVGGGPSGDPYLVPSLMAACVLTELGYQAVNLGPDTPLASLDEAAEHYGAQLVWLSCTASRNPMPTLAELNDRAERLAQRGSTLIIGGRRAADLTGHRHDNLHVCTTMAELAGFARGLLVAR